MATKYFNRRDRERMMVLALLISRLPDIYENFSNNLIDSKQRGRIKAAHTSLNKLFNEIIQSVDLQQRKQLQRGILHHDIRVVETSGLTPEEVDESNDTFLDLMEVVQEERCYQCKLDDVEACPYRIAMLNWSVPVFNEECNDGECHYKVVIE